MIDEIDEIDEIEWGDSFDDMARRIANSIDDKNVDAVVSVWLDQRKTVTELFTIRHLVEVTA